MTDHLYAVGETVFLNFHEGQFFSKLNPFLVEARMPPVGDFLQYRIKSESELCRRVVAEHQLSSFASQSLADPVIVVSPSSGT